MEYPGQMRANLYSKWKVSLTRLQKFGNFPTHPTAQNQFALVHRSFLEVLSINPQPNEGNAYDKSGAVLFATGVLLPKNSPLLPIIAPVLFKMNEQGISAEQVQSYLGSITKSDQQEVLPLSVGQTLLALVTLAGGGAIMAGAVFFFEVIMARKCKTIQK